MSTLSKNLRLLRADQKISQQVLADHIMVSRSNLAKYEKGVHDPGIEVLLRISRYFRISVDILLTVDLAEVDMDEILSKDSMIIPIQVDAEGNSIIEIIPHDASAGYMGNYSDPEYIEQLDHLYLPFLASSKNCRAFPVNGDSMPPVIDGSYIIGEYVGSIDEIKLGSRYIVVSRDEGIVFKRIVQIEGGFLHLQSDNPKYKTFTVRGQDIVEIWEFAACITIQDSAERHMEQVLVEKINALQSELETVSAQLVGRV